LAEPDDGELISRVQGGDVESFAPLVRRHVPTIQAFIALRLPMANASELTHETFVFAFRNISKFEAGTQFRAWLRAIASNLIRAELQRYAREQVNLSRFEQAQLGAFSCGAEVEPATDEAAFLEECLNELPAHTRRLIEERYHRGLSTDELSATFGRTAEWVRITLFRVRKQLRACIEGKFTGGTHAV
jgi:RNA polymerase sigma-70 factor (ECF subfamily)